MEQIEVIPILFPPQFVSRGKLGNLPVFKSEISVCFFAVGLIVLVFYIFFEDLRLKQPFNVIFGFIIVCSRLFLFLFIHFIITLQFECFVIGIAPLVVKQYRFHLYFTTFSWFLILFILIFIGQLLPVSTIEII